MPSPSVSSPRGPVRTLLSATGMLVTLCVTTPADAQLTPYNPYADSQEVLPPVAADGTLNWGTFYKSASLQQTYERLWNLGACRGTNKAITGPVENNKILIDRLPESDFKGVVRAASGSITGGVVAFSRDGDVASEQQPLFAQLHPAGVSSVSVSGRAATSVLQPGMTVRVRAKVDERGRGHDDIRALDIVTAPPGFTPDEVRPNRIETIVGRVLRFSNDVLLLQIDAGRIRRITLPVAEDAIAMIDASEVRLIAPGDTIEVTGRLWSGAGSAGSGTVFASRVTVTKPAPSATDSPRP
jgi:hypothetical protein